MEEGHAESITHRVSTVEYTTGAFLLKRLVHNEFAVNLRTWYRVGIYEKNGFLQNASQDLKVENELHGLNCNVIQE